VLTPSHRSQIERQSAFVIIWEFHVNARKRRAFERAYGPDGDWAKFFREGKGYLGTELIQDTQQPDRYLTMDYWNSRANYETFKKQNRKMYEIIDQKCEALTTKEVEIGKFFRRRASVASRNSKD
jgi:heme-degrading monooxygenase HmoA